MSIHLGLRLPLHRSPDLASSVLLLSPLLIQKAIRVSSGLKVRERARARTTIPVSSGLKGEATAA